MGPYLLTMLFIMYLTLDNYSVSMETQPQQSIDECVGSVASDDMYLLFMMMM